MDPYIILAALMGLILGSFLNMLISRLPDPGRGLFHPKRSACPKCGAEIRARDNIPVLSFLMLRGKCYSCKSPIGMRYLIVEILAMIALVYAYMAFGLTLAALSASVFLLLLLGTAATDLETYLIPDHYTIGGAAIGYALAFIQFSWPEALTLVLDSVAIAFALWLLGFIVGKFTGKEALGFGDVLLVGMMAAYIGFGGTVIAIYLASVSGVLLYVVHRRQSPDKWIPFGLHLAVGGALALFIGDNMYAAMINDILPWH